MKRCVILLFGLAFASAVAEPAPDGRSAQTASAVLCWKNGESLNGGLAAASEAAVTWKTPLFEDPLVIGWSALHRIESPQAAIPSPDPFSIVLRDGSHIYGDLVSLTEKSVTIRSTRHGEAVLKRSEVLSVRRIHGGSLIFEGPSGDVGWDILANRKKTSDKKSKQRVISNPGTPAPSVPPLVTGEGGTLLLPYWNRDAFLDLNLPELVDIEFRVRSTRRPDFQFSVEGDEKQRVQVETWDEDLVLTCSDQFKLIRKIKQDDREVALRLCWDRKARHCSVFSPGGELLAEWQLPEDSESSTPGLVLRNKGRDLALEFLRVRSWDGKPPPKFNPEQPRVELADERIVEGEVVGASANSIKLRKRNKDTESNIPLNEVDAVVFSTDQPKPGAPEAALSYADATLLKGRIASIKDGIAAFRTSFTKAPLTSRLDAFRRLQVDEPPPDGTPPEPPLDQFDKIVIQRVTLHGKLSGAGDEWPRWIPVGGVTPSLPSKTSTGEITRAFLPDAKLPDAPALFYTCEGDVLPGALRALSRTSVELESSLMETTELPVAEIEAIQFNAVSRVNLQGFDDAGWQVLKGDEKSVTKTSGTLRMEPGTSIGHPSVMQGSEIKFTLDANSFSTLRLRMFCEGTDGARATNLIISRMGGRLYYGMETSEGGLQNQVQIMVPSGPLPVSLVIQEDKVDLQLKGAPTISFPIEPAKRSGSGLIIEPASIFGNRVTPIELSDFSVRSDPGHTWLPEVSAETKTQALTVPRFRKDDPARQVLIAANGDVLRGEIEAVTADHFAFRSGLENLNVPRERVSAAVWLKKPQENVAPPEEESPVQKALDQKISRRVRYRNSALNALINFLKRESSDLKFQLPKKQPDQKVEMQFGGQTIASALDQICSLFGLNYRLDDDGTIVLETSPDADKDLVRKIYWLKADAFPATPSAKEILSAKGIPFPAQATARWQPDTRQLTVSNTAANHEKLLAVLDADFGGSLGTPTHWLLLSSGARIGLMVDKFEPDSVSGRHPVYGRVKVPMSEICEIRNSMPEPSAAMKSLRDWRLVYAPEPVLPESGGENSPTLGKEAAPFKLKLLGGGDFDLAREKGKVVVLDFWATWCGPCIKSLPGLIEAMSAFPADRVKLIGVNQSEPSEQVKRFLETRGWKLTVAMDSDQKVGRQYGVDGIPHTVVVGPDGKVAWVKTGYSPEGENKVAGAVKRLLEPLP